MPEAKSGLLRQPLFVKPFLILLVLFSTPFVYFANLTK